MGNPHCRGTCHWMEREKTSAGHRDNRVWAALRATTEPKQKGMSRPSPELGEGPRASTRGQTSLPLPSISDTLSDAMRATPRGDTGCRLRPPKLDRQPSLLVCMCPTDREAAAAPHERDTKKYRPITPNAEMGTVRPHVPYAGLQGMHAR